MKRGPQPKREFNAEQSHVRADKIRALVGVITSARLRAGMERLAAKFEQRVTSKAKPQNNAGNRSAPQ